MSDSFHHPYHSIIYPGGMPSYRTIPKVTITRPNNVTAYAVGDAFGDAANALITLPLGVSPGRAYVVRLFETNTRSPVVGVSLNFHSLLFSGVAPATVIGDNNPIVLSDADIVLAIESQQQPYQVTFTTLGYKYAADPNGLRCAGTVAVQYTSVMPSYGDGNLYIYYALQATYIPIALEQLVLYAFVYEW